MSSSEDHMLTQNRKTSLTPKQQHFVSGKSGIVESNMCMFRQTLP